MAVTDERKRTKRSPLGSFAELIVIVGVAVGLALGIQAFLVKPYRIPSGSMEPTLTIGQRVLVSRIGHSFTAPTVGEIVVFHPPKDFDAGCSNPRQGVLPDGEASRQPCGQARPAHGGETFIKRVVAGPGDTIAIRDGHVLRNGRLQHEPYIRPCDAGAHCDFPQPITVPPGDYFMMGDNRGESDDSRYWGPVPNDWVIGGAFATYWPLDRIGLL